MHLKVKPVCGYPLYGEFHVYHELTDPRSAYCCYEAIFRQGDVCYVGTSTGPEASLEEARGKVIAQLQSAGIVPRTKRAKRRLRGKTRARKRFNR